MIQIFGVPYLKEGSGIHIKEENKGKFTASAKAAGQSVQEHAKSVLNDPNATPLQKKRANFARNAKKWKHEEGAKIHKPNGHRSILDNGWQSTKELKKKRPLIVINANGGQIFEETKKPIDKKSQQTNKPKKKLVVKRQINPTGMVNKRPIPGLLTNELVAQNTKKSETKK